MEKVFIPGLKLVLFSGESGRKLWEAKDRVTPILENGDMVIVPEGVAALICRKTDFNIVEGFDIFASEKEEGQSPSKLALTDEQIKLIVEKYLNDNNLVTLGKGAGAEVLDSPKNLKQAPLTDEEIRIFIEEYASSNNLTVTFGVKETIENSNLESNLTPTPPADDEALASILKGLESGEIKEEDLSEHDKEILEKHRQKVLDEQEPTLDLENILPLEEFETKESLEIYGKTFGINLNKSKKLENMYAELLAHIETLKTK